jgi:hypothetical protein
VATISLTSAVPDFRQRSSMDSMKIVRLKNSSRYQSVARKPVPGGKVGHASPTVSHVRHCAALRRRIFYPHHGHVLSWLVPCSALLCRATETSPLQAILPTPGTPIQELGTGTSVLVFIDRSFFFCFFAELAAMCCVMPRRSETPRTVQLLPQPVFKNLMGPKNSELSESITFYKIQKNSEKFNRNERKK